MTFVLFFMLAVYYAATAATGVARLITEEGLLQDWQLRWEMGSPDGVTSAEAASLCRAAKVDPMLALHQD